VATMAIDNRQPARSLARELVNKVPEVTLYFWVIKVLCTTVGETFADYLNSTLGLGLDTTALIMTSLLAVALGLQFRARRYVPWIYWTSVVLISVVGTLVSDKLVDDLGVSLLVSSAAFAALLALTFTAWYAKEGTLSIHSIRTRRREAFYWLAILFTFALGTSAGDLFAERLNLGYWPTAAIVAAAIGAVALAHFVFKLNAVLSFWIVYVLTRPLGASIGDGMSQSPQDGGLGLGTTTTSLIFLAAILGLVVFLTVSRVDRDDEGDLAALESTARHDPDLDLEDAHA
jgi:uncharacterized membrane-anchored protein